MSEKQSGFVQRGVRKRKPLNHLGNWRGARLVTEANPTVMSSIATNFVKQQGSIKKTPGHSLMAMVQARARSTTKGWHLSSFDVIEKWTEQEGKCALSGKPMTHIRGDGAVYTNVSIDRIDNEKGYTKDNIHLVCFIANLMKSTMSVDELVEWCKTITRHQKSTDDHNLSGA